MKKETKELVEALKCISSVEESRRESCVSCRYKNMEDVDESMIEKYGLEEFVIENEGKRYWISCDCDRVLRDAAQILEQLDR